jgi:uncharacterized protein DUF5947
MSSSGLRRFVSDPPSAAQAGAMPSEAGRPTATSQRQPDPEPAPERCELCAAEIPADHGHLADLDNSSLICACRACYLLFTHERAARGRYRAVPDRYLADPAHPLSAAEWDALEVPVGLAFFLRTTGGGARKAGVTGFYPSPAGATECWLDLNAWERLAAEHPLLGALADDVEAVLISRSGPQEPDVECFVVPVDVCYELAGRMRLLWRGFDGGTEARQAIASFLDGVRGRARLLEQGG